MIHDQIYTKCSISVGKQYKMAKMRIFLIDVQITRSSLSLLSDSVQLATGEEEELQHRNCKPVA